MTSEELSRNRVREQRTESKKERQVYTVKIGKQMPNPICEKCKPADKPASEIQSAVENTGCADFYPAVEACMKKFQGNIASCRQEWDVFQQCMKNNKKAQS